MIHYYFVIVMFWTGVFCWCSFVLLCGFAASRAYAIHRLEKDDQARLALSRDFYPAQGEHESDGQVQGQIARGRS